MGTTTIEDQLAEVRRRIARVEALAQTGLVAETARIQRHLDALDKEEACAQAAVRRAPDEVEEKLGQLNQVSGVGEPTGPGGAPAGIERISVPFFFGARLDATIPLLTLPEELAAETRGPASDPDNPMFRDVGANVLKSRLRSHPDVAEVHHADLVRTILAG